MTHMKTSWVVVAISLNIVILVLDSVSPHNKTGHFSFQLLMEKENQRIYDETVKQDFK